MKQLLLKNFKAFGTNEVEFGGVTSDGKPMSILCYGENGAGKSSVYEAIKYVFHRQRIEADEIPAHYSGIQRQNAERQILINYGNKASGSPTEIKINGQSYSGFDTSDYYVYMINGDDLVVDKQIDVKNTLKSMYLGRHDIDHELTDDFWETIIDETNRVLKECFFENVKVGKSQNGQFLLRITDEKHHLDFDDDLKLHFNEAKLHLIVLIVALSAVVLMAPSGAGKKKILVLDDFITSLDMANRSFLYQYITSCFQSYQIIILTHNTSFYNLCDHFLKETPLDKCWLRQGIYENNSKHFVYAKKNGDKLKEIEDNLINHPERIHDIGNDVRQYFEVLLHQLSQLLMAGAREETDKIIREISQKSDRRIFHVDEHGIKDLRSLFSDIIQIMKDAPESVQWGKVKIIIEKFNDTSNSADKLSENVQAMSIYQKVALHQSSHGHEGLPDLSVKEIKASIFVLRRLEDTIKKMKIERI